MLLPSSEDLKQIARPHYIVNILLSLAFVATKGTPICPFLYTHDEREKCEIDYREREILIFLAVIVLFKGRRAANWLHYLSTAFLFAKLANGFLFFRCDLYLGLVFSLLCIVQFVVFPEPAYTGPENVTYFEGEALFNELTKKNGTTWVIEFYASWNAECRHIAPVFSKLSEKFALSNLKFGKMDLGRYSQEANRFYVNATATSRQLPTIAVFCDGKEVVRRPLVKNQRAIPFTFTEENLIRELGLWEAHAKAKTILGRKTKGNDAAAGDAKKKQ